LSFTLLRHRAPDDGGFDADRTSPSKHRRTPSGDDALPTITRVEAGSVMAGSSVRRFGAWWLTRGGVFLVELVLLVALWVIAILYFAGTIHPRHTIGNMPTAVPWFGALGGVMISLVGVFEHSLDWNPGYALWHWARPFVGATFAVVSVLIFQTGILSVGADPHQKGASLALYYIIGFVVGYREETFRELIKRLVDVLLSPGESSADPTPTISSITPPTGPAGTAVAIDGSGFAKVLAVKFGDQDALGVTTESTMRITATVPPGPAAGTTVSVVVTTSGGTATADYTY
jgi:IPT/TIG domain-containing protein